MGGGGGKCTGEMLFVFGGEGGGAPSYQKGGGTDLVRGWRGGWGERKVRLPAAAQAVGAQT